jgi:5-methylcytosine-specific restriction protein A
VKTLRPFWNKSKPKESFRNVTQSDHARFLQSAAWKRIREVVIRRDLNICQSCKVAIHITKKPPEIDHIQPVSEGGSYTDIDNLQCLCSRCHKKKTAKEISNRKQI